MACRVSVDHHRREHSRQLGNAKSFVTLPARASPPELDADQGTSALPGGRLWPTAGFATADAARFGRTTPPLHPSETSMPQGHTIPKSGNRRQDLFMALIARALSGTTLRLTVGKTGYDLGAVGEPEYELLVRDESFFSRVLTYGNLGFGEAWMDGHVEMARGPLYGLLTHLAAAQVKGLACTTPTLSVVAAALRAASILRGRSRNARHHYDFGDECFSSFLDATLTYSLRLRDEPRRQPSTASAQQAASHLPQAAPEGRRPPVGHRLRLRRAAPVSPPGTMMSRGAASPTRDATTPWL